MKSLIKVLPFFIIFPLSAFSQNCDITIEILPEQYMFGTVSEVSNEVSKTQVEFKDDVMKVLLPLNGKFYKIIVLNENCQAYCKRQKRVRQLNSGDEKLVRNLLSAREEDIIKQIKKCTS